MFFIFGINSENKPLDYSKTIICSRCGKYGRFEVFMTYMCFSLFFIPLIKWNRKYYVRATCCQTLYELNPAIGKRLLKGENVDVTEDDLTLIRQGNREGWSYYNGESRKVCSRCGYETSEDFEYCPKCGTKFM